MVLGKTEPVDARTLSTHPHVHIYYTYKRTHPHRHILCTHTHAHMHAHTRTHTHVHICIPAHTCTHVHILHTHKVYESTSVLPLHEPSHSQLEERGQCVCVHVTGLPISNVRDPRWRDNVHYLSWTVPRGLYLFLSVCYHWSMTVGYPKCWILLNSVLSVLSLYVAWNIALNSSGLEIFVPFLLFDLQLKLEV